MKTTDIYSSIKINDRCLISSNFNSRKILLEVLKNMQLRWLYSMK